MKRANSTLAIENMQTIQPRSFLYKSYKKDSRYPLSLVEKSNKARSREKRIQQTLAKQLEKIISDRSTYSPKKKKVFCIDDSVTVQFMVKQILILVGYQVIDNTDPLKSLMLLSKQQPDLIMMDVKMPGIEGYELLDLIKRSNKLNKIPVVMLTSQKRKLDRLRAKILGASAYITKPFSAEELITVVDRVLSKSIPSIV